MTLIATSSRMRSRSCTAAARSNFPALIWWLMRMPWKSGIDAETFSDPEVWLLSR